MKKIYSIGILLMLFCTRSFSQIFATAVVSCSSSGLCIGGSACNNSANTVDQNDLTNFGTLSTGIGVACTRTLVLALPATQPSGSYAGFFVNTGNVATVLGSISISTYNGNTLVETVSGGSLLNLLTAGKGILQFRTTSGSFNRIAIHLSAVVGVAQFLDVYYGFALSSLLPVQFTTFNYQQRSNDLLLQWTTDNEINNHHFVIEQSLDGFGFIEKGNAPASGALNGRYEHSMDIPKSLTYYRIKQVDQNGQFTYSATIVVRPVQSGLSSWVHPNPVTGDLLHLNLYATEYRQVYITVIDQSGQVLDLQHATVRPGDNIIPVNIKQLTAGIYLLKTTTAGNSGVSACKFIKKN